jgi:hypothetical protein
MGLMGIFLEAAEPLGVIGAQVLWATQPILGLWVSAERVQNWAETLEDPQRFAAWREQFLADNTHHE